MVLFEDDVDLVSPSGPDCLSTFIFDVCYSGVSHICFLHYFTSLLIAIKLSVQHELINIFSNLFKPRMNFFINLFKGGFIESINSLFLFFLVDLFPHIMSDKRPDLWECSNILLLCELIRNFISKINMVNTLSNKDIFMELLQGWNLLFDLFWVFVVCYPCFKYCHSEVFHLQIILLLVLDNLSCLVVHFLFDHPFHVIALVLRPLVVFLLAHHDVIVHRISASVF